MPARALTVAARRRAATGLLAALLAVAAASLLSSGASASVAPTGTATGIAALVNPNAVNAGAFGNAIAATADGGALIAGETLTGLQSYEGWVGKLGANLSLGSQRQLGCGSSVLSSIAVSADGGYVAAGGSNGCAAGCASGGFGSLNCAWVVKVSAAGALQWQDVYPAAFQASAAQIAATSDGGFVVAGSTSSAAGVTYAWIAKLSSAGATQWQRRVGPGSFAEGRSVRQTSDGGYILTGSTGFIGKSSALVVKLSASGALQWQRTLGAGYLVDGESVSQTADGGYIVSGTDALEVPFGPQYDALLVRLTSTGTVSWQRRYDVGEHCAEERGCSYPASDARSVIETAGGNFVIGGYTSFFVSAQAPGSASWLAMTDANGKLLWSNDYYALNNSTGLPYASAFSGLIATAGGFEAAGYTDEYRSSDNIWIVKTDGNGQVSSCAEQHAARLETYGAALRESSKSIPTKATVAAGVAVTGGPVPSNLSATRDC